MANIFTSQSADGYSHATGTDASGHIDGYSLYGMICTNQSGSTVFAQLFDGYVAPILNAIPILELQLGANSQGSLDFNEQKVIHLTKGITFASSSTSGKFTYSGANMWNTIFWSNH